MTIACTKQLQLWQGEFERRFNIGCYPGLISLTYVQNVHVHVWL